MRRLISGLFYILDELGRPAECNASDWARLRATENNQLADNLVMDGATPVRVSTVFLGVNHNFSVDGEPILWETMIFGGEHDGYQTRYSSKVDALAGHQKALALVLAQSIATTIEALPSPDRS